MSTTMTKRAVKYWTVAAIFLLWNQKRKIRNFIKNGSLGIISLSTLILIAHVVAELFGAESIVAMIRLYGGYALVVFGIASLFVVFHNYEEAKKPEFEYAFVLRIWEFMESRRHPNTSEFPVRDVLGVFHKIFEPAGIARASIYRLKKEGGALTIDSADVYPPENILDDYVELRKGEGVAGRVFDDMRARYMPYRSLLRRPFPHAINFEWKTLPGSNAGRPIDLADLDFELDVYKQSQTKQSQTDKAKYKSFLSVPLKSVRKGVCVGVLNLDFSKQDPLDKRNVAMAMVIGLILADEI